MKVFKSVEADQKYNKTRPECEWKKKYTTDFIKL